MRSTIHRSILLICACLCLLRSFSQEKPVVFESITAEEGLSNSEINNIVQDDDGFIWIGTQDGLNRYDGKKFKIFKTLANDPTSISNNTILSIFEDGKNNLWVGTMDGLNKYDPATGNFKRYYSQSIGAHARSENFILGLSEDAAGNIWYGTYHGVFQMDPITGDKIHYLHNEDDPESLVHNAVFAVYFDSNEVMWIGTSGGMSVLDLSSSEKGFKFRNYKYDAGDPNSISSSRVFNFQEDSNGNMWIGTDSGLNKTGVSQTNALTFEKYRHSSTNPKSLSYDFVNTLAIDSKDQVWVGTYNKGLNLLKPEAYNSGEFTIYLHDPLRKHGLLHNEIRSILKDDSDILWVGTSGGLNKLDPYAQKFEILEDIPGVENSIGNNHVQAVLKDRYGNLWIGMRNGGLDLIPNEAQENNSEEIIHFRYNENNPGGLSHNDVYSLYDDSKGFLWIGTYDGFNIIDLKNLTANTSFRKIGYRDGLVHKFVYNMLEEKPGVYWVTTYGGLSRLEFDPTLSKPPVFTNFESDENNPRSFINSTSYSLIKDQFGQIWIGTFNGISRYIQATKNDTAHFASYLKIKDDVLSLSNNTVPVMFHDSKNRIWAGTFNGLNYLKQSGPGDPDYFKSFGVSTGLPSGMIHDILEDDSGNLWLCTNEGIVVFDADKALDSDFRESAVLKTYDREDGLPSKECIIRASHKDAHGNFYVGTKSGLAIFNPASFVKNTYQPSVVLTDFKLFNKSINPGEPGYDPKNSPLTESITKTGELDLGYYQNDFSIEFAALSYSQPQKNYFSYQLLGYNDDWIDAETNNIANYTNLGAGRYTFNVKAKNNDGVWSQVPRSLKIQISPPPWLTWWAYLVYAAAFVGILTLFVRYRIGKKVAEVKTEAMIEKVRIDERERIRKKNAADFHDELGHKLTKISLFLGLANREAKGSNILGEYLAKTESYVTDLSGGIRDFIWVLDPDQDSLFNTLNRLKDFGDKLFDFTDVKFQVHGISSEFNDVKLDIDRRRQIVLIFKEVMNNSLKYSECANAILEARSENGIINIQFSDDGKGFDMERLSNGYGLKNMKTRAQKINAEINIESVETEGTTVNLVFSKNGANVP